MEPEAMVIIEQLAKVVQQNTHQIVTYYTKWHVLNAFGWMFVGAFLCIASYKAPKPEGWDGSESKVFVPIIRGVAFVAGLFFVANNLPNVFAPEAYAIHQLIIDIRGQ